jgi:membrane associated rhomboid family serine protease
VARIRRRFDASQLRITRGALIVAGLEVGVSLVFMLLVEGRDLMAKYLVATAGNVFHQGRVWTLATSPFLQPDLLGLLLNLFVLWAFVPTLERFWGTKRFYRFVATTSLLGTLFGCLAGLALGNPAAPIVGLSPFIYASIVAFGVVYARQPVQFFGVLPLSGRQLMYGFIGFLVLFVVLGQEWEQGAAFAAAMIGAAVMTSKRWSPGLAWRRWRIARARARLSVIEGGRPAEPKPKPKRRDERFIN